MSTPKMQLITQGGPVPISVPQLRALCANPKTETFILGGVSTRWIYDALARCPGQWSVFRHEVSEGLGKNASSKAARFHRIKRKAPASERGVLIAQLREAKRNFDKCLEALLLELRAQEESAEEGWTDEGAYLSLEDFEEDADKGEDAPADPPTSTTFSGLLGAVNRNEE